MMHPDFRNFENKSFRIEEIRWLLWLLSSWHNECLLCARYFYKVGAVIVPFYTGLEWEIPLSGTAGIWT